MNLIIPAVALGAWYISTLKSTGEKLQRCEITSFKLGKLNIGLQETIIPVTLQVFNPNSTAVAAEYFRGKVFRAGIRIADFSFDSKGQNVQLQPRTNTPLTFNVRIGSVGAVKTIFDIFKNLFNAKALDTVFSIDGIISISGIDIPVQFSFDAKTGQPVKAISGIGGLNYKDHYIQVRPSGYGHWKISMDYRGRNISTTTTDSMAVDDYNSSDWEKDGRQLRKKRGYEQLKDELIRSNYK